MAQTAIIDEDHGDEHEHPGPQSFITKYIWSQDRKVIAIQYSLTAISIGLVALVLSWLMRMQIGFPGSLSNSSTPSDYLQFVSMHGMIMVVYLLTALFLGGFGNYLIPLMVGARDMVFPYVNMVSYWIYLLAVLLLVASFFVPGGPSGAGWTLYPPQAILRRHAGAHWGIILMLVSLMVFVIGFTMGGLNYVVTVLQARTRGMTMMRLPLTVWGIFMATILALAGVSRPVRQRHHDAAGPDAGHQLLHARTRLEGAAAELLGRQSAAVPAPVLVLRPPRGLHRGAARLRHRVRPDQHPRAEEHLRLPHDGLGDPGDRRPELRRVGTPHVRERHEPVLRLLLRHHHADHRGSHRHQGLQLGADAVARQHPPHGSDAVRHRVHLHFRQWRPDRPVPGQRGGGHAAVGHDVRRGAFPHGDGDRAGADGVRGHLPLVPEGHRAHAGRHAGQDPLLDHFRRDLRDLLPDALPGLHGHPAPLLRIGGTNFIPDRRTC